MNNHQRTDSIRTSDVARIIGVPRSRIDRLQTHWGQKRIGIPEGSGSGIWRTWTDEQMIMVKAIIDTESLKVSTLRSKLVNTLYDQLDLRPSIIEASSNNLTVTMEVDYEIVNRIRDHVQHRTALS